METKLLSLSILTLGSLFFSCQQENEPIVEDDKFEEVAFNYFENVSQYYPEGDVKMTVTKNASGEKIATYQLIGESKELAELGSFAARTHEEGTTCSSALSCGKALKKCLDDGDKGVISNGKCEDNEADYCVTCEADN